MSKINKIKTKKSNISCFYINAKNLTDWYTFDSDTGEIKKSRYGGGSFETKPGNTPSLLDPDSYFSRIVRLLLVKGAIGSKGLSTTEIKAEFFKTYGIDVIMLSKKLSRLASKRILFAQPNPNNASITLWSIADGARFYVSNKQEPSTFLGGKADSLGSNTPSLKRPNSDYSRLLAIMRDGFNGNSTQPITQEFNKRHGTTKMTNTIQSKLGRLAAKKIIIGKPDPKDARTTLWFLRN